MVGHIHLMTSIYNDIHEVIASLSMNIIVGIGFCLDYRENIKKK